jgi:hypothetical protein
MSDPIDILESIKHSLQGKLHDDSRLSAYENAIQDLIRYKSKESKVYKLAYKALLDEVTLVALLLGVKLPFDFSTFGTFTSTLKKRLFSKTQFLLIGDLKKKVPSVTNNKEALSFVESDIEFNKSNDRFKFPSEKKYDEFKPSESFDFIGQFSNQIPEQMHQTTEQSPKTKSETHESTSHETKNNLLLNNANELSSEAKKWNDELKKNSRTRLQRMRDALHSYMPSRSSSGDSYWTKFTKLFTRRNSAGGKFNKKKSRRRMLKKTLKNKKVKNDKHI